jgi:hypothetical protein
LADYQEKQGRYERTKELTDKLEAGMKELFQSGKYEAYLKAMSHFHHYSSRNIMLINMQMPAATRVASFKMWGEQFKRHVKKGERSIRIFAPIAEKKPEIKLMQKLDTETGAPLLDAAGKPVMEEMTAMTSGPRFKLVPVFDVSQTYGEPLPELVENLTGDVAHYEAFMDALRAVSPLPIILEPMDEHQDGYCRFGVNIGIREGMSEIQTVSAAVHEIAHAKLHDRNLTAGQTPKTKAEREIEAESVSYVVNQHFGIETSPNSFGYLAEYGSREMPELQASLDTIRKEASSLISAIDENFQAIRKDRGIDLTTKPIPQAEQPAEPPFTGMTGTADTIGPELGIQAAPNAGHYEIYQLRDSDDLHYHRFASLKQMEAENLAVCRSNYDLIYTAPLSPTETLDGLYERFNNNHPKDYTGRSLSVSDVIVIHRDSEAAAHYVDTFGFSEIPAFLTGERQESITTPKDAQFGENVAAVEARVKAGETISLSDLTGAIRADQQQPGSEPPPTASASAPKQEKPAPEPVKPVDVAVYKQPPAYAREHGELDLYRQSNRLNTECAAAIDKAVRESQYDTYHYRLKDAAKNVIAEYGAERVDWVLASTVQLQHYDGRYSDSNKKWARGFDFPGERPSFFCNTHPHILNGFIDRAKEVAAERPSALATLRATPKGNRQPDVSKTNSRKSKGEEL